MAPKRKSDKTTISPAVTTSPRRTRSATSGKRPPPPPPPPVKRTPAKSPAKTPAKKQKLAKEEKKKKDADVAPKSAVDSSSVAIIVEACTQCRSFKERANIVKEGVENAVAGIAVTINPDKPRRGCFEIRKASGEAFISLLDLKRPFKAMMALDMDKVVEDIVEKIK